jgi:hypothetical protein
MNIDGRYRLDSRGRIAAVSDPEHIKDLIEAVLFTSPGERVNRPDFGCGLRQLVFSPNSDALAAAIQLAAQSGLQQWVGSLIRVDSVTAEVDDATLRVSVQYVILQTQQRQNTQFERSLA